jgi:hypothetical protein
VTPFAGAAAAATPKAPVLVAPANETSTPVKDVVLRWDSVAGASSYQVEISPNADWNNNLVTLPNGGKTVRTTVEVPLSLPHASYFWRVRATVGGALTDWSDSRQFLHDWADQLVMTQTPTSSDPSLSWKPVPEASEYIVRFSQSPDFSSSSDCVTDATSFTPYAVTTSAKGPQGGCFDLSVLKNDTKYYWQVRAYDDSSAAIMTSDTTPDPAYECASAQPECDAADARGSFTFESPTAGDVTATSVTGLDASWRNADGSTSCSSAACPSTPSFSWDPVPGANYYEVHIYRDPYLTNSYAAYTTGWPHLTPREDYLGAQAGQAYYWTVSAGTCENSDTDLQCSQPADSGSATLGSPGGAQTCTTAPPTGSDDGTADPSSDGPCISSLSASPAGPTGDQSVSAGTSATITLTGSGFTSGLKVTATPDVGTVSSTHVSDDTVTFTYAAPATPQSVSFTATNPDGQTAVSPPLTVSGAKTTIDAGGGPVTFKESAGTVDLASPSDGATLSASQQTFSWGDYEAQGGKGSVDARNYRLQIASDPRFQHVVLNVSDIDMTQYTDPKNLPRGSYSWRVAPIDEDGNLLTWSDARTVLSDASTPHLHLAPAPERGLSQSGTFTIRANEPVRGVSSSSVHIAPASGGGAIKGKLTQGTTPTSWYFRPTHTLVTGQTYVLQLSSAVTDPEGNPAVVSGKPVHVVKSADDHNRAWKFSRAWTHHKSSNAIGGDYVTAEHGHATSLPVAGRTVSVYGCKAPRLGHLKVYLNGHKRIVLSEHQSYTRCGLLLWKGTLPSGTSTLRLAATSKLAGIDAVRVS